MKPVAKLVLAAALAAGLSAPAVAENVNLGTIPLGSGGVHTFLPSAGSFTDYLTFRLGAGASGALVSTVTLQLSNILGISGLSGLLYSGAFDSGFPVPGGSTPIGVPLTAGSTDVSFGPLASGSFYTLVYTGTATGVAGGAYTAAVAAVPEAHEWAMMLSGLGLLGFVVSRRRKAAALAA